MVLIIVEFANVFPGYSGIMKELTNED